MTLRVRNANGDDLAAVHAIYSHHVLHGFGTFDEVPPTIADCTAKWRDIAAMGLPWLVAAQGEEIVGFAYASAFRPRSGYRYTLEDSVYIRDDRRGRGIGTALLTPLVERCAAAGARQVVAVIGDSANAGSISLHAKAGYSHAGTVKAVGFKLGRWVDIVFMQRALNGGDGSLPPASGAWRPV